MGCVLHPKVLLFGLDELPDANPLDMYWTIVQLIAMRIAIVKQGRNGYDLE
nr:hypothetical protein [Paenibacillus polymyxa]